MKFFYIDNNLCARCSRCSSGCPTGSVTEHSDGNYINYDTCNMCGNCVKSCINGAVVSKTLQNLIYEYEKTDSYRYRISMLESELEDLRSEINKAKSVLHMILESFGIPAALSGSDGELIYTNSHFENLLSPISTVVTGESKTSLKSIVRDAVDRAAVKDNSQTPVDLNGTPYRFSAQNLNGETYLILIRNTGSDNAAGDRSAALIRKTIADKLEMVKKIGNILGEGTASQLNDLNEIIAILEKEPADE